VLAGKTQPIMRNHPTKGMINMDENQTDTPLLDEVSESSFTKELMKTAAINTAATAGVLVGFVVVGFGVDKVRELREKRAAKKAAALETTPNEA